jgi:hypothetical protein
MRRRRTNRVRSASRWLLHVALPLLAGSTLYLLWRPRSLVFFDAIEALGHAEFVDSMRVSVHALAPPAALHELALYSVPNALWLYAFTWAVRALWREHGGLAGTIWLAAPVGLGVGLELGQGFGLVSGTFDASDLWTSAVAVVLGLFATRRKGRIDEGARIPSNGPRLAGHDLECP